MPAELKPLVPIDNPVSRSLHWAASHVRGMSQPDLNSVNVMPLSLQQTLEKQSLEQMPDLTGPEFVQLQLSLDGQDGSLHVVESPDPMMCDGSGCLPAGRFMESTMQAYIKGGRVLDSVNMSASLQC